VTKKLFAVLLLASFAAGIYAQELIIGGEVKTGLLMTTTDDQQSEKGKAGNTTKVAAGSKDDAGSGSGRFRLNMEFTVGNFGIKARLQMENWGSGGGSDMPDWTYAFGYVNVLEDQVTVSMGKLGASPWGTGGPELWKELESIDSLGGMRVEYKPYYAPGLNVGFVINAFNGYTDMYPVGKPITLLHVLQETVIGASYTHDLFMIRAAYRFDSVVDKGRGESAETDEGGKEGGRIVYRVEEYVLKQYIPNFSIWALGYWYGVGASEVNKDFYRVENWLFIQFAPEFLTAQIRAGYDVMAEQQVVHVRPSLYGHLFNRRLTFGGMFKYAQDFGTKRHPGSPYYYIEAEPLIQFNLTSNSYIAAAYNWRMEYVSENPDHIARGLEPIKQTQWINVRVGMTF